MKYSWLNRAAFLCKKKDMAYHQISPAELVAKLYAFSSLWVGSGSRLLKTNGLGRVKWLFERVGFKKSNPWPTLAYIGMLMQVDTAHGYHHSDYLIFYRNTLIALIKDY